MTVTLHNTDRDIFQLLCTFHFLTTSQIATFFNRHESAINRRLRDLSEEGYVHCDRETVNDQYIWHPQPKAITDLIKVGLLASRDQTTCKGTSAGTKIDHKHHEVAVSDVGLNMMRQAHERTDIDIAVEKFDRGPLLHDVVYDHTGLRYRVRPDACMVLRQDSQRHVVFIEVDRGTKKLKGSPKPGINESPHDVRSQLYAYTLYHERGAFTKKYRATSFRVLIAARTRDSETSTTRRNNMLAAVIAEMTLKCRKPPASPLRWYAVLADVINHPYDSIFLCESATKLLGTLSWVENQLEGCTLADLLPTDTYDDVRAALPDNVLRHVYNRPPTDHDPIRNALLDALIMTGRIRKSSILEH